MPLLIGGATTSAKHTAVKIAPAYSSATVHVLDASRSVGVVDRLLKPELRGGFEAENRAEQKAAGRLVSPAADGQAGAVCRGGGAAIPDRLGSTCRSTRPAFLGRRVLDDYPLEKLVPLIDWSPFFMAWELKGKYPRIFDDPSVGEEARKLFDDAQRCSTRSCAKSCCGARRVRLLAGGLPWATTSCCLPTTSRGRN